MNLPTQDYNFYCGIDPGFSGAIAVINRAGTTFRVWDMPVTGRAGKQQEYDLDGLRDCFRDLRRLPGTVVGIEWPSTRPGEGAERSERFGRGKGYLESFAYLHGLSYFRLAPNGWKGRLGLPGKSDPDAVSICYRYLVDRYPAAEAFVRGPRGGLRDGRIDALLIAHFLRDSRPAHAVAAEYGKGSLEAQLAILGWGGNRRRHRLRIR